MYGNYFLVSATVCSDHFSSFTLHTGKFSISGKDRTRMFQRVQNAANRNIILLYWITPTLLSIVVLKDTNFHFDGLENMAIVADKSVIQVINHETLKQLPNFQRNTLMALIVVSITCIISSLAYGALFIFVRKNSSKLSK